MKRISAFFVILLIISVPRIVTAGGAKEGASPERGTYLSGKGIIDPKGFTKGTGLNKAMVIIMNAEDQTWRSNQQLTPTNEELKNKEDHTFKVDWIRIYRPVSKPYGA